MAPFSELEVRGLPVVVDGRIIAMLFERDVLFLYSRELDKLDLANAVISRRSFRAAARGIELAGGLRLDELPLPATLVGQSLRQADLRRRYGVEVLYLLRGEEGRQVFPDPDHELLPSDRLVVMGKVGALERLRDA